MLTLALRTRPRPEATGGVTRWVKDHAVALAGAGLVAAQLGWTATLLAHSYFRQDDFVLLDRALRAGFGWRYLLSPDSGHLMPAGLTIIWALARTSLYDWLAAGAVIMVLTAAASAALLRVLLTLFGARPAILVPLTVYLFAPLSTGTVAVLSAAFFGTRANTSRIIAPLAAADPGAGLSWTASPAGVLASPMMFDGHGRLRPLAMAGLSSAPRRAGCWKVTASGVSIPVRGSLYRWSWTVRLSYSGPAGVLVIGFGGSQRQVTVPAGRHDVYVPAVGQGSTVSAHFSGPAAGALCVTRVTVGSPRPDLAGQAIPAATVPG